MQANIRRTIADIIPPTIPPILFPPLPLQRKHNGLHFTPVKRKPLRQINDIKFIPDAPLQISDGEVEPLIKPLSIRIIFYNTVIRIIIPLRLEDIQQIGALKLRSKAQLFTRVLRSQILLAGIGFQRFKVANIEFEEIGEVDWPPCVMNSLLAKWISPTSREALLLLL